MSLSGVSTEYYACKNCFPNYVVDDAGNRSETTSGRTSAAQESVEEAEAKYDDVPDGSIFVGDLCKEVLELDLKNTFAAFGDVIDVVIKRSRTTCQSLGYGFVTMKNSEQAQHCLEKADDVVLKGRKIRIAKAQRNTKLIVSNLSETTTTDHLNSAFGAFGKVLEHETCVTTCGKWASVASPGACAIYAPMSISLSSSYHSPYRSKWLSYRHGHFPQQRGRRAGQDVTTRPLP